MLENVKNLQSHDKKRTFEVIRRTLVDELGYDMHVRVIDGGHFVPQHRERILIVGFREAVAFDWNLLELPSKPSHTLRDILHRPGGAEPQLDWDGGRFFDHTLLKVQPKYTLTPHLWDYLQAYKKETRGEG